MATNLRRIRERARKNPGEVFTSLWHHVCDEDHLRACYEALDGKKAVGIDGVDKKVYGETLEVNLKELSAKLQRLGYRPQAKRRHYIPKAGSERGRPLAISNFEDKIVERAVKVVLEQIYLHYVLDLWFSKRVAPKWCKGEAYLFRYADDFVACFQYRGDAAAFMNWLRERFEKFGLELAEEKTKCLAFGRFARETARKGGGKPEGFTFLGFDHYCGKSKEGHFKVKRRTNRKKLGASLRRFSEWCRESRRWMIKGQMLHWAKARIVGHLNYYAITDNSKRCDEYVCQATRILFKWLNRKSQRNSYRWEGYLQVLKWLKWPTARVRKDLNPFRREEAL
jgi:hypothetical protein